MLICLFANVSKSADIAFLTANNGTTPTILKTTDGGTSWTPVYTGTNGNSLRDIYAVDASTIYAVGDINLKSTDGGTTWNQIFTGLSLNGVSAANADKVIAVGQGPSPQGRVIVSDDGGTSYTQTLLTPTGATSGTVFNRVDTVSATTAFLVGQFFQNTSVRSVIYKTSDGGSNWTPQSSVTGFGTDIAAVSSNVAFSTNGTATAFGFVRKTADGTNWSTTAGTFPNLRAVAAWDENLLYVAGNSGSISKSTNGGSNWSGLSTGTASQFNDIAFLDETRLIAVGQFGLVRRTLDGGTTWTNIAPSGYSSHVFTSITVVPEPSSLILTTLACGLLAWKGRNPRRNSHEF